MAIFLKQSKYKNGKTYLSIVNGFYDSSTKNSKQITLEKIGFLENFLNEYEDPISFFLKKQNN